MKKKSHSVTKSYLKLPVIALISLSASPWWKREPPILANSSCLPDPSSLRPGALFITNCSGPDSGRENPASLPGCSVPPLLLIQWLIPKSQHFKFILFLNVLHIVSQWKGKKKSVSHSVVSDSLWPVDRSPPGSCVHGSLPARILEWVAIPFSRGIILT